MCRNLESANQHVSKVSWDWYQRIGPSIEVLGDLTERTIADLGAGTGCRAALIAQSSRVKQVIAIDSSPAQAERARAWYGDIRGLTVIQADAADYLHRHPAAFDVCYSAFGALTFTDPRVLLPAVATGLRPAGKLVIATLAHCRDGSPAAEAVRPTYTSFRDASGNVRPIEWWVLAGSLWHQLLTEAGFDHLSIREIRDPGTATEPAMAVNLISARKPASDAADGAAVSHA